MPTDEDRTRRRRLGDLLTARRYELDRRYSKRETFAAERGVNARLVSDIEHARRDNFTVFKIRDLEDAYELAPGAIGWFLEGRSGDRLILAGQTLPADGVPAPEPEPEPEAEQESEFEVAALRHELEIEKLRRDMAELWLRLRDLEARVPGESQSWQPRRRPAG